MNSNSKRIALLVGNEFAYGRRIWLGVGDYAHPRKRNWQFMHSRYTGLTPDLIRRLGETGLDGAIAQVANPEMEAALAKLGIPVVNTSASMPSSVFSSVGSDDILAGRAAADYLSGRGVHSFGFVGIQEMAFSNLRARGFRERLAELGHATRELHLQCRLPIHQPVTSYVSDPLGDWLQTLPRPTALFAASDDVANEVAQQALLAGVHIPEDICLLGADNDELICEFSLPRLSSLDLPARKVGYEAARILDLLIQNPGERPKNCLIPPGSIVVRSSTDLLYHNDDHLARALRFIETRAVEHISVVDVVRASGICRSLLERRFRQHLNRSPLEEIHRVRIEHAKKLLTETKMNVQEVAEAAGFRDAKHIHSLFKKATGMSPRSYRQKVSVRPTPLRH